MRRFTVIIIVLLILAAACTAAPPLATPVSPAATPAPATHAATSAPQPTGEQEAGSAQPPVDGAGSEPKPGAGAALDKVRPSPAARDKTAPVVTITVDPPELAWDAQATVTVRASDPAGIKEIDVLLGDQLLATGSGEEMALDFIPGAIDGLKGDSTYTLVAYAIDMAGNEAQAQAQVKVGPEVVAAAPAPTTAAPAATPAAGATEPPVVQPTAAAPAVTTEPRGTTTYRVTEVKIPTYPYQPYLQSTTDPDRADYPVFTLDRPAYSAANPQPQLKSYRLLVLENRYLRLGILPDLGGRIYECIFKPTGSNEFYSNTVIKPTTWGPPSPPYAAGANWWTGAGGLEWGFPVEEHGYEFGTVWGFDHATLGDGSIMITVYTTTGPEKPYSNVDIILPPDTAYFVIQPRVVNPLGGPFKFKFWENAMLAPGKANTVSPDLQLYFPAQQVTVHSTGDPSLPQAGQTAPWPVIDGRDLSKLGNWRNYLGVFATPVTAAAGTSAFAGVYDPAVDEGMVRVFPTSVVKGVKLFAPRGTDGLDPALWTDDGSSYVELHGGLMPTFADWYELGPTDEVTWSEFWYPVAKIGGLTFANDRAALSLAPSQSTPGALHLGLFPTTAMSGALTVTLPGTGPGAGAATFDVQLSPEQPLVRDLPLSAAAGQQGEVGVTLVVDGETVFDWQGVAQLR